MGGIQDGLRRALDAFARALTGAGLVGAAVLAPSTADASQYVAGSYIAIYYDNAGLWYDNNYYGAGFQMYDWSYYYGMEDVTAPGSPWVAMTIEYDEGGTAYQYGADSYGTTSYTVVTESNLSSGSTNESYYKLTAGDLSIVKTDTWGDYDTGGVTTYQVTNNGKSTVSSFRLFHTFDPDPDYDYWYDFYTYNDSQDVDYDGYTDLVVALGYETLDAVALGACEPDKEEMGSSSAWDSDADATLTDDDFYYGGDSAIGWRHSESSILPGQTITFSEVFVTGYYDVSSDYDYYALGCVTGSSCVDADGDGQTPTSCGGTDCDDTDKTIYLGAKETCNSKDDDCDGTVDDGVTATYYRDSDKDGYGDKSTTRSACSAPSGYVTDATDCDDTRSTVNPKGTEVCNSIDDDCDGSTDEGVTTTYYYDADGDGYGDKTKSTSACSAPTNYVSNASDCDDTDKKVNPAATEVCNSKDDDCDGYTDEGVTTTYYKDADGDGYGVSTSTTTGCSKPSGYSTLSTDCDDTTSAINPGATETCNSKDDDCDGLTDEGVTTTYYLDSDGDGYGVSTTTKAACSKPSGYSTVSTDCDDANKSVNPGATETCNSVDDDCDGSIDEGVKTTYYRDADGDGYGTSSTTTTGCSAPSGYVANATDCDDGAKTIYPGATETCNSKDDDCDGTVDEGVTTTYYADSDKDGYGDKTKTTAACSAPSGYVSDSTDCDDTRSSVNPKATEICDSLDDDCDGSIDEGVTTTYYQDADGDGYGDKTKTTTGCSAPTGYVSNSTDCDDTNKAISPAGTETCNSKDDDCDGLTDEGVTTTYYKDADGDGYGVSTSTTTGCSVPAGYSAVSTDCDDTSSSVHPGATETCNSKDDDCDGLTDEGVTTTYYLDSDGDGYGVSTATKAACSKPSGYATVATDCDDTKSSVNPGATETCNAIDDDCDGSIDEGVKTTYYRDADGDGYGNSSKTTTGCSAPTGYTSDKTDCDDTRSAVHPGATEYCNGYDDNCDGTVDEDTAADAKTWYRDSDGDGYGDSSSIDVGCSASSGFVSDKTDCDDTRSTVHPGATETCNSRDDDCDGSVDEGVTTTYYKDGDGDGYGDASKTSAACSAPSGYVASSTDCDDATSSIHPGATETCNSKDDDCDGSVDEGVTSTFYKDADADGYGDKSSTTSGCSAPSGYVADKTDCDDTKKAVNPAASELCNGYDDDCDGTIDESTATDAKTWYADGDGDGYGDASSTTKACSAPSGYVSDATDCDDTDATTYPGAPEVCDGVDNDCDGSVDEGATGAATWYADADGDGYGDASTSTSSCSKPSGYVKDKRDCDDTAAAVNPGASEVCNGIDDDCDGSVDESSAIDASTWYADKDGDGYGDASASSAGCSAPTGYVADKTDCDDALKTVHPGAAEYCDGYDDDCDGVTDESDAADASTWYADVDGDSYGDASATAKGCIAPSGYVADKTDCDDTSASISPAATEVCNGYDDDCDGLVDEAGASGGATWYADADGDGYGDAATSADACDAPSGYVADATDCDDTDPTSYPGAEDVPYDGIDQDCDGADVTDVDGDGHDGVAAGGDDCDDTDATIYPGTAETADGVDSDCNGLVDDGTDWYDDDGDGYTEAGGDCDDGASGSAPNAVETCNGLDDDCDGVVDEETGCYDDDGDGVSEDDGDCNDGDAAVGPTASEIDGNGVDDDCDGSVDGGAYDPDGDGYTEAGGDCDPADATTHPGATELLDGLDNDCDGTADEGTRAYDDDGDGVTELEGDCDDGDPDVGPAATEDPDNGVDDDCDGTVDEGGPGTDDDGDGVSEDGGDCDDANAEVHPGADEVANGLDDDCDGATDEGLDDADGDGKSVADGDCDDDNGWVGPGFTEMCDGIDNNCDGVSDEGCDDQALVDTKQPGACGCASDGAAGTALVPWLAAAWLIRRRRPRGGDGRAPDPK